MKKKYQIIGLFVLVICSAIYNYQQPEKIQEVDKTQSFVILEGEFLKQGEYVYEGNKTIGDVVKEVGVSSQANIGALKLDKEIQDESHIYLPPINNHSISLNTATKEEFMTIKGIGEKTAQKIIDYRNEHEFTCLEDIMNVSGIGEKTYMKFREQLCL